MSSVAVWVAIAVAAVGTYGLRLSFIHLFGSAGVPPRLRPALRLVPAAVLAALVLPPVVYVEGSLALGPGNERIAAAALAAVVAWRTRNMLATLGVGMATLWTLRFLA